MKINSEKAFAILIILTVLLVGCSNKKLIEPLVQTKGTYNYLCEIPKANPDLINTCIDYMTYAIGATIIIPIAYTGIYEHFAGHCWIWRTARHSSLNL
jgi:hypothetical protein